MRVEFMLNKGKIKNIYIKNKRNIFCGILGFILLSSCPDIRYLKSIYWNSIGEKQKSSDTNATLAISLKF